MTEIIDSHTHRYPPEVFLDPEGWARDQNEAYWASLTGENSLQAFSSREQMLEDMDAAGVSRCVILGWYWEHQRTCELNNDWLKKWKEEDPERFIMFATVQPAAGKRALTALETALDEGWCSGLGELLPKVQGFSLADPVWLDICTLCSERGVPICLHATEPVGHPYAGRVDTPLMEYVRLAQRFPNLKLILAHWGGGLPFYELNPWCRKALRNVFYDTAASPLLYEKRVWKIVKDLVGPEKILFGSDYPLRIYPRDPDQPGFKRIISEIQDAAFSNGEIESILGRNLLRLLGDRE